MEIYATEEEQVQQIKKFVKTYGKTFLLIVVVMSSIGFAWRAWQDYRLQQREAASLIYDTMAKHALSNDLETAVHDAKTLQSDYGFTPYADFAILILAKAALEEKDTKKARHYLQQALNKAALPAIKQIARLQLAALANAANDYQSALTLLNKIEDPGFLSQANILKGDALLGLKRDSDAKAVYEQALSSLPENSFLRPLLQLKIARIAPPDAKRG